MPRAGLSTEAVVDAALALIDQHGDLTLAAVAERTGVATPSLYKHVGGLGELRTLVGLRIIEEIIELLTAEVVGRSGDDAVRALLLAYRRYVREHPARYAAMPQDPLHDPDLAEAGTKLINIFFAVLRAYGLQDSAAVHAIRRARVIAHGFTSLEAAGGFGLPEQLDDTYDQLISMYLASLEK